MKLEWSKIEDEYQCSRLDGVLKLRVIVYQQMETAKYYTEISGLWHIGVGTFLHLEEAQLAAENMYLKIIREEFQSLLLAFADAE